MSVGHTHHRFDSPVNGWQSVFLCVLAVTLVVPTAVRSERWYGNLILSALRNSSAPTTVSDGNNYQIQGMVNVEDVLFYKNRMRLATNQDWRHQSDGFNHYRPIYFLDIIGYGYTYNGSYSRFKDRGQQVITGELVDVFTRDQRHMLQVRPLKWPTFSLLYSHIRTYNNEPFQINNLLQRTFLVQSTYTKSSYTLRGTHQRMRTDNYGLKQKNDLVKSTTGNFSFATPASSIASASVTYSIFDSRRSYDGLFINKGTTNSVSVMATSTAVKRVNTTLSYSGQFTANKQTTSPTTHKRSESFGANLGYAPTSYLDFQAIKGYQIDGTRGKYDISEYVTLQASASRYFRQGVDARFSVSRIYFQKADRTIAYPDSTGALDSTKHIDHFHIDTWFGSLAFGPVPYVKMSQSVSVTRDSDPLRPNNRYQMNASTDAQFHLRANLEGKLSYGNTYQGERLRLGHLSGETYNAGLTWSPLNSVSLAGSYIHSVYNTTVRNSTNSVSFAGSYSFRRVYSVSISYNRRDQHLANSVPNPATIAPETINGQILIRTSARSTLTVGYLHDQGGLSGAVNRRLSTWHSSLNLQL